MTKVNFYVLQQNEVVNRHHFVCRLAQKMVNEGNKVLIATHSAEESAQLDDLLWQFKPESFIPHSLAGEELATKPPLVISHEQAVEGYDDLLINLRPSPPPEFSRFHALAEVVIQQDAVLKATRANWAFYKERGYELNSYKVNA